MKNLPANAGDTCSIPGLGRSPGEGNGNPFQYSYLENPINRGAWQATVHGVTRVGHNLATRKAPKDGKSNLIPSITLEETHTHLHKLVKIIHTGNQGHR